MQNSDPYIISHSELQSKDPQQQLKRLPKAKTELSHRFIEP
jgi:hypothetical protein